MSNPFDLLIDSFLANNIGIDTEFISAALSEGLQQNILQLQKNDSMVVAGIGKGQVKDANQQMRGDKIYWLDKGNNNLFEQEFLLQIENFIAYLNSTCYTGITGYEFHYAVYEAGAFYKRHKDQFKNENHRKYSLISYLNNNWLEEEGGQLRIYHNENSQDIMPRSETSVFFKSGEMEHEVITSSRQRMSITGWLKC